MNTSVRGHQCEDLVIQYYLERKNLFLFRHLFHGFAELDLVFLAPNGHLIVVEVKSVKHEAHWLAPLQKKQTQRLRRAWVSLQASAGERCVEFHLALVDSHDQIEILPTTIV